MMDSGSKIAMEGGSGYGQRRHNGRQDGKAITIGNRTAVAQWMAQLAVDNCCLCRSGAMGGNVRWTAMAITMDSGSEITMDSGSGNGQQWRHNGQWDGKAIAIGNGTAVA